MLRLYKDAAELPEVKKSEFVVRLRPRCSTLHPCGNCDKHESMYTDYPFEKDNDALAFFSEETERGYTGYIIHRIVSEYHVYPVRVA